MHLEIKTQVLPLQPIKKMKMYYMTLFRKH